MQKYGLIGYPLGHSFSKNYFNQKFESENIDATYLNFEIPNIKDLKTVLKDNPELNGLNVTIPYKEQVIPYLDDLDEDARLIGAVNVIKFTKGIFGKKLKGYNSDIIGFKRSIEPLLNETHRKALILGTGGASKAVFQGLRQLGVGATLVSRKPKEHCITYEEITPKTMQQYTRPVNCVPSPYNSGHFSLSHIAVISILIILSLFMCEFTVHNNPYIVCNHGRNKLKTEIKL